MLKSKNWQQVLLFPTGIFIALMLCSSYCIAQDLIKDTRNETPNTRVKPSNEQSNIYRNMQAGIIEKDLQKIKLLKLNANEAQVFATKKEYVSDAAVLSKNSESFSNFLKSGMDEMIFEIPVKKGKAIRLVMQQVHFLGDDFAYRTGDGEVIEVADQGLFYEGYVMGNPNSFAALSIFEDNLRGLISDANGDYVLATLGEKSENYILYNDKDLLTSFGSGCGINDPTPFTRKTAGMTSQEASTEKSLGCVEIRVECEYSFYQFHGSKLSQNYQYVLGQFNEARIIYANEDIDLKLVDVLIWRTPSPYTTFNSSSDPGSVTLNQFSTYRQNNDDGPINLLLYHKSNWSGGWAWLDYLCQSYVPSSEQGPYTVVNNYSSTLTPFPGYSQDLENYVHEIGHVLGANHTHDCVWGPSSNAALDNCFIPYDPVTGNQPGCAHGPAPTSSGTIMSYCASGYTPPGESQSVSVLYGIDLINGMGAFPGTVNNPRSLISNRVSNASCCSGANLCNEDVFSTFSWLSNIINPNATGYQSVDVYKFNSSVYFVNVFTNGQYKLYYNGNLWCTSSGNFNCVDAYNLNHLVDHWDSDCGACEQDDVFAQFPWLSNYVNENNCTDEEIVVYKKGVHYYIHIQAGNSGKLYYNNMLWCTDSQNFDCVAAYGLTQITAEWACCNGNTQQPRLENDALSSAADLKVFPNPNRGIFEVKITASEQEKVTLNIFNLQGQLISSRMVQANALSQVDISDFGAGIYMLRVISEQGQQTAKVIVQ